MSNGNELSNWYAYVNAQADREFERLKAIRLEDQQAGQVRRRIRPIPKTHSLIISIVLITVAIIGTWMMFTGDNGLMILSNWGR
jgi:hypothetical protein